MNKIVDRGITITDKIQTLIVKAISEAKDRGEKQICLFECFRSGPLSNRYDIMELATYNGMFGVKHDGKGNWYWD